MDLLVEASYTPRRRKAALLERVNLELAALRWLVRMAKDRRLLSVRQYGYACERLAECGRMTGGWLKQVRRANVYLNALDHFVKHALRCKGYVRYMDDFLLFGHDRRGLKEQGRLLKQWVGERLRLEVHPDKYRLVSTGAGVDFCGFVVYADGRIRVRARTARRFQKRYRHQLRLAHAKQKRPESRRQSGCRGSADSGTTRLSRGSARRSGE